MATHGMPHLPAPYRPGCTVVKIWWEDFEDRVGNKAKITKVDYTYKGKLTKGFTMFVRWL